MNQSPQSPELPLPAMQGGEQTHSYTDTAPVPLTPEHQPGVMESPGSSPVAPPVVDDASGGGTTPDPSALAALQIPPQTPAVDDSSSVDDVDVIQKEWVERAKAIVNKTSQDPRLQSSELGKFKAEYVQKRFHKELKTTEDAAA